MYKIILPLVFVVIFSLGEQAELLWVNDPANQRELMNKHAALMNAAQWKADYIAATGDFAHCTRDGECSNKTIKRFGCITGYDENKNFVESLVWGTNAPDIAYENLLRSSEHVQHLHATNEFFRSQTDYGVGHADLIFVFISAKCE